MCVYQQQGLKRSLPVHMVCQPIQRVATRILHEFHVTELISLGTLDLLLIPACSRNTFQMSKYLRFFLSSFADLEGQE